MYSYFKACQHGDGMVSIVGRSTCPRRSTLSCPRCNEDLYTEPWHSWKRSFCRVFFFVFFFLSKHNYTSSLRLVAHEPDTLPAHWWALTLSADSLWTEEDCTEIAGITGRKMAAHRFLLKIKTNLSPISWSRRCRSSATESETLWRCMKKTRIFVNNITYIALCFRWSSYNQQRTICCNGKRNTSVRNLALNWASRFRLQKDSVTEAEDWHCAQTEGIYVISVAVVAVVFWIFAPVHCARGQFKLWAVFCPSPAIPAPRQRIGSTVSIKCSGAVK